MTLGTHAIVGGALASLIPTHPLEAFCIGFASHFVLDSIPHFDYKILSISEDKNNKLNTDMKLGKNFILDLIRIGADALIGVVIVIGFFYITGNSNFLLTGLLGAFGAILPDALQFAYFKLKSEPLISLQKFHLWVHADKKITDPIKGLFYQLLVVLLVLILCARITT